MFGVASNFRKSHGEAAFQMLARSAFGDADTDDSGRIDMSELHATLSKMGMRLNDAQAAAIVEAYDDDGNHELDVDEFMKLVAEIIDGTAMKKLPLEIRRSLERVEARGIVKSVDDLFGSDDEDKKPKKKKAPPKPVAKPAASKPAAGAASSAKPAATGGAKAAPPKPLPAAEAAKLQSANAALTAENGQLSARVKELEAQLAAAKS